jgi:CheY-like chemotaxis protein
MARPLESMVQILDSLLGILQMENGLIQTVTRPVSVQRLLEEAYAGNVEQARAKGLSLSYGSADCIAFTDPHLLQRALGNLVSNAIQHSERGSVSIDCVRGERTARIEVSDTGPGIPADKLGRVFDDYYQLGSPELKRAGSVGLGLAIVKQITVLLEHRLKVVSAVGRGSVFSIEMPLAEAIEPSASAAPKVSLPTHRGRPRILFVEDDAPTIDAVSRLLARAGLPVDTALSGEAALALVSGGFRPDLLVTDHRLPGLTGVELIRRIRKMLVQDLPSIVLTGDTSAPDILASLDNCTVLQKPIDGHTLLACVERGVGPVVHLPPPKEHVGMTDDEGSARRKRPVSYRYV